MKTLFHRLQPPQKFRINISDIAQLLKIPKHLISACGMLGVYNFCPSP